jgi:predicted RNA-binding Zn-ribbon protein involved in translation (DUF1610 family)
MTDENTNEESMKFICPNCGEISRDDVIFLCNTCKQEDLIFQNGVYMCPACLTPGENFQCMKCDSKEVTLKDKKPKPAHKS